MHRMSPSSSVHVGCQEWALLNLARSLASGGPDMLQKRKYEVYVLAPAATRASAADGVCRSLDEGGTTHPDCFGRRLARQALPF